MSLHYRSFLRLLPMPSFQDKGPQIITDCPLSHCHSGHLGKLPRLSPFTIFSLCRFQNCTHYLSMLVDVLLSVCVFVYACMQTACPWVSVCSFMQMCFYPYSFVYVCVYIYIYIYTHTHTHTHNSSERAGCDTRSIF